MILFNPGPVNLAPEVKDAVFSVELCHRQPEFALLETRVREGLYRAARLGVGSHLLSLLHGSGALAVDAALATLVRGRVLVLDNGVYCRRIARTLAWVGGAEVTLESVPAGTRLNLDQIAARVASERPQWIATVHHETMTGVLNPLSAIADIAEAHGARLFVDAVSSFGVHPVDGRSDVICFNSSKCLESLPGIGGVFWRSDLEGHPTIPVLDLARCVDELPSTPNVQAFLALEVALDLLAREDRAARYARLAHAVWSYGGRRFEPLLPESDRSHVLTAFRVGEVDFQTLMDRALEHGFVIYGAQEELAGQIFRVANMGAAIDEGVIAELFEVLSG